MREAVSPPLPRQQMSSMRRRGHLARPRPGRRSLGRDGIVPGSGHRSTTLRARPGPRRSVTGAGGRRNFGLAAGGLAAAVQNVLSRENES